MPSKCTIQKRKRGAWGPDDYYLKCDTGTIGFWKTRDEAQKALAKIRSDNKKKK